MGSLVRVIQGDNLTSTVRVSNLKPNEVVRLSQLSTVIAQNSASTDHVVLDLSGYSLPLSGVTLETYLDGQLTSRAVGIDVYGGDEWEYRFLLDLKVDGIKYSPGDVISFGRMTSLEEYKQIEVYNPNVLPLYGVQLQLNRPLFSFGYEWVWISKDGESLSKVLDLGTLQPDETWVGRLVQKVDPSYPPPTPSVNVEVELNITAQSHPEIQRTRDLTSKIVVTTPKPRENKVLVLPMPGALMVGVQPIEVRFPFNGTILELYASCRVPGSERTVIHVEKISQEDYDGVSSNYIGWVPVGKMVLEPNDKSVATPPVPEIYETHVSKNDHFRVRIEELGTGLRDLTVEVVISV